jgi:opacity protein-like surface antigen
MVTAKKSLMALITGITLLSASASNAHNASISGDNYLFSPGAYIGLDLGWAKFHGHHSRGSFDDVAGGVFLGYDFTENWSAQVSYNHLSHAANMVDVLGRLNVPVSQTVSFFGEAGPAWVKQPHTSHRSSILPEAGAGVAFLPSHNTKIDIGYRHVFGHHDTANLDYIAAGFAYKFPT